MELSKDKMRVTLVGFLFLIYITAWSSYIGENVQILLYGGYAIVCSTALIKMLFYDNNPILRIPKACSRLFVFSVFCAASMLWAINSSLAASNSLLIVACVVMVIIMTNYFVRLGDVRILHLTIVLKGIVMAIVVITDQGGLAAFYETATASAELEMEYGMRVGGELINANTIGLTCGYSAIVLFYYAVFFQKKYCYAIMVFPVIVLIASASRKAILLLGLGILLILYFKLKEQRDIQKYIKILFGGIALLILVNLILSLDIMYTVSKRMEAFLNLFSEETAVQSDESSSIRQQMIIVGWKQFLYKPFWGIGLGNSVVLNSVKLNHAAYSHNDYIEHLVNGGVIGFFLYYSVFYSLIKEYLKIMKTDKDPNLVISFVIMILLLLMNMACVSYYGEITVYVYFVLWISQIGIKKKEIEMKTKV